MRIALVLTALLLSGCGADRSEAPPAEAKAAVAPSPVQAAPSTTQMAQWTRNCALCHVHGEGGAPVLGDQTAWAERREQGEDVLLAHTLEGFNNMPPLGYCMDCETTDFTALIRFMSDAR